MGDGSVSNCQPVAPVVRTHEPGIEEIVTPRRQDSLTQFLDAGISLRRLLWHGLVNLDWLAQQSDHKLRICYRNAEGTIVEERVNRIGLLKRAEELGWNPWPAEPGSDDSPVLAFLDAVPYSDAKGRTWWSTEYCEDCGAPLCFPERQLEILRQKARRRTEAMLRQLEREKAAAARSRRKELRDRYRGYLRIAAEKEVARSIERGRPIKFESAMRKERRFFANLTRIAEEGLQSWQQRQADNVRTGAC